MLSVVAGPARTSFTHPLDPAFRGSPTCPVTSDLGVFGAPSLPTAVQLRRSSRRGLGDLPASSSTASASRGTSKAPTVTQQLHVRGVCAVGRSAWPAPRGSRQNKIKGRGARPIHRVLPCCLRLGASLLLAVAESAVAIVARLSLPGTERCDSPSRRSLPCGRALAPYPFERTEGRLSGKTGRRRPRRGSSTVADSGLESVGQMGSWGGLAMSGSVGAVRLAEGLFPAVRRQRRFKWTAQAEGRSSRVAGAGRCTVTVVPARRPFSERVLGVEELVHVHSRRWGIGR